MISDGIPDETGTKHHPYSSPFGRKDQQKKRRGYLLAIFFGGACVSTLAEPNKVAD